MFTRQPCRQRAPENHAGRKPRAKPEQAGRYFPCSIQETGPAYGLLECHHAVNTIGAEDAELAFIITAEVDETAVTLAGAG